MRVDDVSWLADGAELRVVNEDDRFAGYLNLGDVPSLFGVRRDVLGVIGLNAPWIDKVRQLPNPYGKYAQKIVTMFHWIPRSWLTTPVSIQIVSILMNYS